MDEKKNDTFLVKETHENIIETLREKNIKNLILIKTKDYDFYKLKNIIDYVILAGEKQINLKSIPTPTPPTKLKNLTNLKDRKSQRLHT